MHTYAYIKYLLFNNVKKNQLQLKFDLLLKIKWLLICNEFKSNYKNCVSY